MDERGKRKRQPENLPPLFWLSNIWERLFLRFGTVTVLQSNRMVGLPGFGVALALVNKCWRKTRLITIFHRLSSPPVIILQNSHHLFNPGVKVSCLTSLPLLCQVSLSFATVLPGFFPLFGFRNENLCWKLVRVSHCKCACFIINLLIFMLILALVLELFNVRLE
jgi:hypothetical protein